MALEETLRRVFMPQIIKGSDGRPQLSRRNLLKAAVVGGIAAGCGVLPEPTLTPAERQRLRKLEEERIRKMCRDEGITPSELREAIRKQYETDFKKSYPRDTQDNIQKRVEGELAATFQSGVSLELEFYSPAEPYATPMLRPIPAADPDKTFEVVRDGKSKRLKSIYTTSHAVEKKVKADALFRAKGVDGRPDNLWAHIKHTDDVGREWEGWVVVVTDEYMSRYDQAFSHFQPKDDIAPAKIRLGSDPVQVGIPPIINRFFPTLATKIRQDSQLPAR